MRKTLSMISAIITGGISIALISIGPQLVQAGLEQN